MPLKNSVVILVGRGSATLRPSNYMTSGGEASIYRLGDMIVKIFTDHEKMTRDAMSEKIRVLTGLQHPRKFIVAPLGVVEDASHSPIGYYMPFAEGEPLSRVFTTAFRQRSGFGSDDVNKLVHNMREVGIFAHTHGAIMADANELNWLMRVLGEPEPRIVDVDSWQIGQRWPARVVMPSIRDWHCPSFDEKTDWFSWGIVTFQAYTGIHPYKGRHDAYKPNELERRMRDNVSVFHYDVRLNAAVRDFNLIPGALRDWYFSVFENGVRSRPPSPFDPAQIARAARVLRHTVTSTGSLVFEKLYEANEPVIRVHPGGLVVLKSGKLFDLRGRRFVSGQASPHAEIVTTHDGYLIGDPPAFCYLTQSGATALQLDAQALRVIRNGNRLFAVTDRGLSELSFHETGSKTLLTSGTTWGTLSKATQWFEGFGVQDSLGAKYLILPFGDKACGFIRVPELDKFTVVNAKSGFRFVTVVIMNASGDYQKYEFTMDRDHKSYTVWSSNVDSPEINLAVLPNGVVATIVEDGELVIFVPVNGNIRKIRDKDIHTDMQLATYGDRVVYVKDNVVWAMAVK